MAPRLSAQEASGVDVTGPGASVETRLVDLGFPCHLACTGCDRVPERTLAYHQARRRMLACVRARRADVLRLVFHGGDVFALPQSFTELLGEAAEEAQAQGMALEGVVLSDGTSWSLDLVRRFRSLGVATYFVSIDGPAAVHDRGRPAREGGSFELTMNSLLWHRDGARVELRVDAALDESAVEDLLTTLGRDGLLSGPNPVSLTFGPRRTCRQHAAEIASRPYEHRPR